MISRALVNLYEDVLVEKLTIKSVHGKKSMDIILNLIERIGEKITKKLFI
jgi:hypothetical protein